MGLFSQQSPIDLSHPVATEFGKDGFEIKWKKSAQGRIKKDDHGIQVVFGCDERQYVVLNRRRFHLVQFHFHHPSEHWLNGKQQTMELHVVHQNVEDGDRVVAGIFIDASEKSQRIPTLVSELKAFVETADQQAADVIATNPLDWLPDDVSHYYRYEGSLTTPQYDENVSWVIFREPLLLPKSEVVELVRIFSHPARHPQPLNRRYLLANFE